MRRIVVILVIFLGSGLALGAEPGAFTGFWKTQCKDAFGLQIKPFGEAGKYSVSFCGPGGCFEPGTYRPLTTIENDPAYEVISSKHIKVVGRGGSRTDYFKCSTDTNPLLRYDSPSKTPKEDIPSQKT